MDLIALLQGVPLLGPYLPTILAIAGLCAAAAAVLPPPKRATGAYVVVYTLVNWVGVNLGHAKNASAPLAVPKPPLSAIVALLATAIVLSACVTNPDGSKSLNPQVMQTLVVMCDVDGVLVPVAQPVVAAMGPAGASVAAADTLLGHPAVVAACKALNGKPAAAAVK